MKTGSRQELPSLLLCVGPEKWLQAQAIERLKSQCLSPGFEEMDFIRFDEPTAAPHVILEAVKTSPFGSPYRLVVVDGIEEMDADSMPWLPLCLDQPNPRVRLVVCAGRLDEKTQGLLRKKPEAVQILWCQPLKGKELRDWIVREGKLAGKVIEPEAAALLIGRCGAELHALAMAIESLSLLVGTVEKITVADVESLIAPSMRETAFDILDEAAAGRPAKAIEALRQALLQGHLTVEQLMGALGWYYRMVWKAQSGVGGGSWGSPNRPAALARLTRWPQPKLQAALEEILQADAALKLSHPTPELMADQLLLKLSS